MSVNHCEFDLSRAAAHYIWTNNFLIFKGSKKYKNRLNLCITSVKQNKWN